MAGMLAELIYTHGTASFLMLQGAGGLVIPSPTQFHMRSRVAIPPVFAPEPEEGQGDYVQHHLYSLLLNETRDYNQLV